MSNQFKSEEEKRQWEQFQAFQKQQNQQNQKFRQKKSRKGWFWGCGGCLVLFILIIIGISACTAGITGNLGGNYSKETNKTHKIGETVKNGDLEVTVNSVETMKSVGPSIAPTNAKGTFVVADVTIKNKGKEALTIDSSMFKLKTGDKTFEADNTGSMSANQNDNGSIENSFFLQRINPDSTAQGKIVFDVSENIANAKDKKLEVISSLFSVKKITFDLSDAKKTSKAKKENNDEDVATASSNNDNVNYEASATTPSTSSSANNNSEENEQSSKDEDKQDESQSDKSSVEKSESKSEPATAESAPQSKPVTSEAPPSQNNHNEDSMYDASTE
ncbi:TPA: DUF4352 domain-containing protein [Staphylococcus argenteus]|uniref:DUF4352 domain-containing protein n=1 Tax=Staphylococcus argenteus TaxID=985002 RepID=UPI0005002394|nr:DUF4352 domain-containing protein [Staphylococcus argenteus]MBE2136252.1 DUF4352 domain-containing protein [Staphylococcus argenteus]MDT3006071.1 DUF4352 domain-containing protein [Staphylococcus argenteus]UPO20042.1 DUF4352 domain-containing protein [Staphylococcus argenteus]CDR63851.1 telomeric repeat-binding factor 2 family protein [Staphylococcus argenteus]HDY9447019.1 DUF4352 domain-containing protein [Staphylococcus argenteus]